MGRPESRALARLGRLLAQERRHLREGRYDRLEALDREKAALVQSLGLNGAGEADLQAVRGELLRNQRLREAAREGLRAAQANLARQSAPLRTYGPDGQPGPDTPPGGRLVRRV